MSEISPNDVSHEFENEGRYEQIAVEMAQIANSVVSEYRDHFINSKPMCRELWMHAGKVRTCKNNFKNYLRSEKDFRVLIIAFLDLAQEIFKTDRDAIATFHKNCEEAKKETERTGSKGFGASGPIYK